MGDFISIEVYDWMKSNVPCKQSHCLGGNIGGACATFGGAAWMTAGIQQRGVHW